MLGFYMIQIFTANTDGTSPVTNKLLFPFEAKGVKLVPVKWHFGISLRWEILGCFEGNDKNLNFTLILLPRFLKLICLILEFNISFTIFKGHKYLEHYPLTNKSLYQEEGL